MMVMLITFGVFLFIIAAMAIGVIVAEKPLKGSCGGLSSLGLKDGCPICGGNDKPLAGASDPAQAALFYDATAGKS